MNKKVNIGISIGDPSGIGPEVTVKALKRFKKPKDCEIFVFGDKAVLTKYGSKNKFNLIDSKTIKKLWPKPGVLSKQSGLASLLYLKEAVRFLKKGVINCLVTAPVSKEAISLNNIKFRGHTEFLAEEFGVKKFVMMFISENLKVSLVTRHIALKEVSPALTKDNISTTISLTHYALRNYFKINNPRIAVLGLNPHASEDGLMGNEEGKIIKPAINKLKKIKKNIYGPFPADTVFKRALNREFHAVVCMYHDQGLIPFKMLHFGEGVNLTVGLPFIRTSCVHGTAFDIAGKGKADCRSMLRAIELAYQLTKNSL